MAQSLLYYMPWATADRPWGSSADSSTLHDSQASYDFFLKAHHDNHSPLSFVKDGDLLWEKPRPLVCSEDFLALVRSCGGSLRLGKNLCRADISAGQLYPLNFPLDERVLDAAAQAQKAMIDLTIARSESKGRRSSL